MPSAFCPAFLSAPPQALFLDRDGTIIEERHYLRDPDGVALLPGAGEALGRLVRAGIQLVLVTNQSGIGRGYFSETDFRACQSRLEELLRPWGAAFADVRFCPHGPEDGCACRKPRTGMWERARAARNLDPARCVMAGDKPDDLAFGINAGFAAAVLVRTGYGAETAKKLGLSAPEECPRDQGRHGAGPLSLAPQSLTDSGYALPARPVTRLACVADLAELAALLCPGRG